MTDTTTAPADAPTTLVVLGHVVATRCTTCEGDGEIPNPVWHDAGTITDPDQRERVCARLAEQGVPDIVGCGDCDGDGWLATAAGAELLAFVRRYGTP